MDKTKEITDKYGIGCQPDFQIAIGHKILEPKGGIFMLECPPMKTLKQFLASDFEYCMPAPGGAIADGGIRCNQPGDAYLAALAQKAKRRVVKTATTQEYLERHLAIVQGARLFDEETDAKIITRIGAWLREFAH